MKIGDVWVKRFNMKRCVECGEKYISNRFKIKQEELYCLNCREKLRRELIQTSFRKNWKINAEAKVEKLGTSDFSSNVSRFASGKPNRSSEAYLVSKEKELILNNGGLAITGYTTTEGDKARGIYPNEDK